MRAQGPTGQRSQRQGFLSPRSRTWTMCRYTTCTAHFTSQSKPQGQLLADTQQNIVARFFSTPNLLINFWDFVIKSVGNSHQTFELKSTSQAKILPHSRLLPIFSLRVFKSYSQTGPIGYCFILPLPPNGLSSIELIFVLFLFVCGMSFLYICINSFPGFNTKLNLEVRFNYSVLNHVGYISMSNFNIFSIFSSFCIPLNLYYNGLCRVELHHMLYLLILPSKYIHINIQRSVWRIFISVLFVNNLYVHQYGKCEIKW